MDFSNEKVIGQVIDISNDDILPNRFQPRKYFDESETLELADSIKEHGILQPVVVRQVGDKYEIIAGERRFKANILAGNDSIPAIVNDLDDKNSSEIAIIENIQRQNLTPIEEAISYKRIIDMGYLTQEQLARKIGKSQSAIANKIRLLKLSDNVQDALMEKKISERHARSLLKLDSLKKQDELLEKIIKERLTVRKTDEEIKKMNNEVINNNIQNINMANMPGEVSVGTPQPVVNNQVQDSTPMNSQPTNIFGNPSESTVTIPEPDIPVSSVSPIMGSPISSFAVEDPTANDEVNSEGGTSPAINNVAPDPLVGNNDNLGQPITPIDPTPVSPVSATPQPEPVQQPVNNVVPDPINSAANLDIFNNNPTNNVETPVNFNPLPDNNMLEPVSEIRNSYDEIQPTPVVEQPVTEPVQSMPISNTPIIEEPQPTNSLNVNPIVTDPISPISVESVEPVQDQPLASTSINQFNINTDNLVGNETSIQPMDNTVLNQQIEQPTPVVEQPVVEPVQPVNTVNEPVVDLTPSEPQPVNNDTTLNTVETPISNVSDPIIVSNDDNQFDPIMPEKEAAEPTLDFKTIINLVRQCSQTIEKCGYVIDTEEIDMGDKYQVTFTIDK